MALSTLLYNWSVEILILNRFHNLDWLIDKYPLRRGGCSIKNDYDDQASSVFLKIAITCFNKLTAETEKNIAK